MNFSSEQWHRFKMGELSQVEMQAWLDFLRHHPYDKHREFVEKHLLDMVPHFLRVQQLENKLSTCDWLALVRQYEQPISSPTNVPSPSSTASVERLINQPATHPASSLPIQSTWWRSLLLWFQEQWFLSWALSAGCVVMVLLWKPWELPTTHTPRMLSYKTLLSQTISPPRLAVQANPPMEMQQGIPFITRAGRVQFSLEYHWDSGLAFPYLFLLVNNKGNQQQYTLYPKPEHKEYPVHPGYRLGLPLRPFVMESGDYGHLSFVLLLTSQPLGHFSSHALPSPVQHLLRKIQTSQPTRRQLTDRLHQFDPKAQITVQRIYVKIQNR